MIEKFKAFLAGNPHRLKDADQKKYIDILASVLPGVAKRYDAEFEDVWSKDGIYYERMQKKLAGSQAFKKAHPADAGYILRCLKYLVEFSEDEKRKAAKGKTSRKPKKATAVVKKTAKEIKELAEGEIKEKYVTTHERNKALREECIRYYAEKNGGRIGCEACGMTFAEKYGEIGAGYIEIHHLNPISQTDSVHTVDPKTDLIPLCANCHAMIHRVMSAKGKGKECEGKDALQQLKTIIGEHQ